MTLNLKEVISKSEVLTHRNITQAYGQIKRNKVVAGLTIFTIHGGERGRGSNPPTFSIVQKSRCFLLIIIMIFF